MKKIFLLFAFCCMAAVGTQAAKEMYAVIENNTKLKFYYDDQRASRGGETDWQVEEFQQKVTSAEFDKSFQYARPTTTYHWFFNYKKLTTIKNLSYLNTVDATSLEAMFSCCEALSSLDLRTFNTAKVKNMSNMFYGCKNLKSIDLSSFNTGEVQNMDGMFRYCENLQSLDLGKFDMANVTRTRNMFEDCKALETIYYDGNWNSGSISSSDSQDMFKGCVKLVGGAETPYDDSHVNVTYAKTDGGTSDPGYFTLPLRVYTVYVESSKTLTYYYGNDYYTHTEGTMEFYEPAEERFATYHDQVKKAVIDASLANVRLTTARSMFYGNSTYKLAEMETIKGLENLKLEYVTDMALMFYECSSLTALDLSSFRTNSATTMQSMFAGCSALTSLNISNFSTGNVTIMSSMFRGCSSLQTLDVSRFQTGAVTSMSTMFQDCKALEALDVTRFNTANVTNMASMFRNCEKLTYLDVSGFDISKVTNTNSMFDHCKSLVTIVCRTNWAESMLITSYNSMFDGCTALVGGNGTTYDNTQTGKLYARPDGINGDKGYFSMGVHVYTHFDGDHTLTYFYDDKRFTRSGTTETYDPEAERFAGYSNQVTFAKIDQSMKDARLKSTRCMFYGIAYLLKNLTTIEGMENLNTEEVGDMGSMFSDCESLTSIDLSHFNTWRVTDMRYMFAYCKNLQSIDLSSFKTPNVENMNYMFCGCTALKEIDINSFSIQALKGTAYMFSGCTSLKTIWCDVNWSASSRLTNSSEMFNNCTSLQGGNGTMFDSSEPVDKTYACPDTYVEIGYFSAKPRDPEIYAVLESDGVTMTIHYDGNCIMNGGKTDWSEYASYATTVVFSEDVQNAKPTTTNSWFSGFSLLEKIEHIEYLNTEKVNDMTYMFYDCSSLTALDVSHFKTDSVQYMTYMFSDCELLETLDVSRFITDSVRDMEGMFLGCKALKSLNLSRFKTDSVRDMSSMFGECEALETLDLSSFKVDSVTSFYYMFANCAALKTLNLKNWKPCAAESTNMMFYYCSALTTIYCNNDWTKYPINTDPYMMFDMCTELKGQAGTTCNGMDFTGIEYARPDKKSAPGYFTEKDKSIESIGNTSGTQESSPAQKLLHNGQLLILCNGHTYTATGAELK